MDRDIAAGRRVVNGDRSQIRILKTFIATAMAMALLAAGAASANAAGISVSPNTNDVVGLKSNNPTSTAFPNTFPLGARVCNTSGAAITGTTASLTWGTATGAGATNVGTIGPTSIDLGTLDVGACLDAYYTVVITRASASFDSTREYAVSVTGSSGTSGTTPAHRRIYVEKLISQNRNNTRKIAGSGGCNTDYTICDPPPSNLVVGNTYTFKLYGDTATSQNTVEAFLDFPGTIFRVLSASSTASLVTAPAQASVPGVYNDACVLQWDYTLANYKGCTGTGGAGGTYAMTYSVTVISAGSGSLKAVIYDGSAANWHLNSDYGTAGFTSSFTARWPLDVTVDGSGDVTSNPAGVNCGISAATCQGAYDNGTSVTLTATPTSGETFTGWSGAGCSGTGTCTVAMTQARAVSASFTGESNYPLSVSVSGLGSVSSADSSILLCTASTGVCSHSYGSGASVMLTATPDSGQSFAGWSGGGCSGLTVTCTVTMDQIQDVTASFASSVSSSYNLTVATSGSGLVTSNPSGISCGAACSSDYASGASVELTAAAEPGSVFSGWGGACSGTATTCAVTMSQIQYVTATFVTPYTLTVGSGGAGSGTVTSSPAGISCGSTCSYDFDGGTDVTLTATATAGSVFTGWSGGGCTGTDTCVVSMSSPVSVTATFATSYVLDVTLAGSGSGAVASSPAGIDCGLTCTQSFSSGSVVTLTAQPALFSQFSGWSGAGTEACSGTTCDVTMSQARSVTATFSALNVLTVNLTGSSDAGSVSSSPAGIDCGATCAYGFADGTVVTLTATPAAGAVFNGWSGGGCSGTGTCEITISAASEVTASFTAFYSLSVNPTGAGDGTVTASSGAINCGVTCSDTYEDGTVVTLSASAEPGSVFTGWNGSGCSGTGDCVVTTDATHSVSAAFELPPSSITTPVLSGNPKVGSTLTASDAAPWSGSNPISVTFQWQRCDAAGLNCVDIDGATDAGYELTLAEAGLTVVAVVTGENMAGSFSIASAATPVIVVPPINQTPPVVSGNAGNPHPAEGTVLTATIGTWAGDEPMTYAFQWQHCDQDGSNCADIGSATGNTYTVTADDVTADYKYRVLVTATNPIDQAVAAGAMPAWPETSAKPVISGTTTDGQTLTTTNGTWNGTQPISFSYQWQRCDVAGLNCVDIDEATEITYQLTGNDVGHTMRVAVTATNSAGTGSDTADQTAVVAAIPPANVTPPVISGGTVEGATLSASDGTWTGTQPITYSYQWRRCDADGLNCIDIDGATSSTYVTTAGDAGSTILIVVTAVNAGGSAFAASDASGVITLATPTSSSPPVASGTPVEGETLSTTDGTWAGTGPFSFSYQWRRCDADGLNCIDIDGAYASTYLLTTDDIGATFIAVVTATNAGGEASASTTPPIGPVAPKDPVNTAAPSISGVPLLHETLTTDPGEWTSPSAITFTYQWQRCDVAGLNCVDIDGATGQTYDLVNADVGAKMRVAVTATNATGASTLTTDAFGPVAGLPPENTLAPSISGTPATGQVLTADPGEWDSFETPTLSFQWQLCDSDGANCVDIVGATASTYTPADGDAGSTIRVVVVASNSAGSTSQTSAATGVIAARPTAITIGVEDVTATSAVINGTVQSRAADTTYQFQYGADTGYGINTASSVVAGSDTATRPVSVALGALTPNTTYHFRVTAGNSVGSTAGEDMTFTTAAAPAEPPSGPPADFDVVLQPTGMPQEKVTFHVGLPAAGRGVATGRVPYDRRYAGPRSRGTRTARKTHRSFVAFTQRFSATAATGMDFRVRLNRRALRIIRRRGFLRINVTVRFTPSDGSAKRVYRTVVRLRPFTITSGALAAGTRMLTTTVRTPRRGSLHTTVLLRNKRTGKSTLIGRFSRKSIAAGIHPYSMKLNARSLSSVNIHAVTLIVKADFRASKFPWLMWRTRFARCTGCGG